MSKLYKVTNIKDFFKEEYTATRQKELLQRPRVIWEATSQGNFRS